MDKFLNKKRNFDENEFSKENSLNAKNLALRKLIRSNRKYDDTYLNFGFLGLEMKINLPHCVWYVDVRCQMNQCYPVN